jgi:hypothetical protein
MLPSSELSNLAVKRLLTGVDMNASIIADLILHNGRIATQDFGEVVATASPSEENKQKDTIP